MGFHRLSPRHLIRIGSGRAHLQSKLAVAFMEHGMAQEPIDFKYDSSRCVVTIEGGIQCNGMGSYRLTGLQLLSKYAALCRLSEVGEGVEGEIGGGG